MWNSGSFKVAVAVAAGTGLSTLATPETWLVSALFCAGAVVVVRTAGRHASETAGRGLSGRAARWVVADVLAVLLLASGSAFGASMRIEQHARDVYVGEERIVTLTGIAAGFPRRASNGTHILLEGAREESSRGRAPRGLRVFLRVRGDLGPVLPGDTLTATGVLRRAENSRNPGGFSEAAYMFQKAAHAVLTVPAFLKPAVREAKPRRNPLALHVSPVRSWIERAVEQHVPGQEGAFLTALLLGDRGELTEETRKSFRDSGIVHLLAVSGLHTALVGMVAAVFLRAARFPVRAALLGSAAAVWLYCSVSGFHPSTLRASVMVTCYVASRLLGRDSGLMNTLCASFVALLLANPKYIWEPGFQLSYAATFSIVGAAPLRERLRSLFPSGCRAWRYVVSPAATTCVAQMGVLPVLAVHFGTVSAVAVPVNLLAIPLVSGALVCSFCSLAVQVLSPQLASAPFAMCWLMLRACALLAHAASSIPGASLELAKPSQTEAVVFLVCLAVLLACAQTRWRERPSARPEGSVRLRPWTALVVAIAGLILCWLLALALGALPPFARLRGGPTGGQLRVSYLDVGQGDAAVVSLPDGKLILVDGGNVEEDWDCAERVLMPFLRGEGARAFDVALLTHFHADHAGGILELLRRGKVRELLVAPCDTSTALCRRVRCLARERRIAFRAVCAQDTIFNEAGVRMSVVHPSGSVSSDTSSASLNDSSLVAVLVAPGTQFVFTADVGADIMDRLAEHCAPQLVTVLKAPHHGSRLSLGERFASTVRPGYVVFSAGRNNRSGHPADEVVAAYESRGAEVFRTDRCGCVSFTLCGDSLKVRTADSRGRLTELLGHRARRAERKLGFLGLISWSR